MQLNKWLGSDKPKKDDFNSDNQKIDEACRLLSQSVEQLEYAQENNSYASSQAVAATAQALASHTGDDEIHVTAAEKASWSNGAGFMTGYYTGTGELSQTIFLGFQPKFGLLFAVNECIANFGIVAEQIQVFCGCMSQLGCSRGIVLHSDGFTVSHSAMGGLDGIALKYNASGTRYVYFLWQ